MRISDWSSACALPICIFAWHDPEGGDPTYDLPLFQEWDDPRWIRWTIDELEEMDVHQPELAEHGVDKIHNANVHGQDRLIGHRASFEEHRGQTSSPSVQFGPDGTAGEMGRGSWRERGGRVW